MSIHQHIHLDQGIVTHADMGIIPDKCFKTVIVRHVLGLPQKLISVLPE